jgi:hypothetical protein
MEDGGVVVTWTFNNTASNNTAVFVSSSSTISFTPYVRTRKLIQCWECGETFRRYSKRGHNRTLLRHIEQAHAALHSDDQEGHRG